MIQAGEIGGAMIQRLAQAARETFDGSLAFVAAKPYAEPILRQVGALGVRAETMEAAAATVGGAEGVGVVAATAEAGAVIGAGVIAGVSASCAVNPNVFGDPHLVTLDGRSYNLQVAGEFHLFTSPASNLDLQGRFVPAGRQVSVLSAVALRRSGHSVELAASGAVTVDGLTVLPGSSGAVEVGLDTAIYRSDSTVVAILRHPDVVIQVRAGSIGMVADPSVVGRGLLGNNDRDPENDLETALGESVKSTDLPVLYGRYADSWRITDANSAFTYAGSENTSSYTDRTFPASVTTLADFSADELQVASRTCVAADVAVGPALEDCMYDLLVTGDDTYVKVAAAVPDTVVGDSVGFVSGALSEDYTSPVGSNLAAPTYLSDAVLGRMAGPFFDDKAYTFTVTGVPRHDTVSLSTDLVLVGDTGSDSVTQRVVVWVDDKKVFDGHLETTGSEGLPAGVTGEGSGTLANGTSYRKVRLGLSVPHVNGALKVRIVPEGFKSILGVSLAVNQLDLSLVTPPAQSIDVPLPTLVSDGVPSAGAGRLETAGGEDDYLLTINGAAGSDNLLVETACQSQIHTELYGPDGAVVAPADRRCEHRLYEGLPNGLYRLAVTGTGSTATYTLKIMNKPVPQVFDYAVGQKVEDGKIGGQQVAGAGNLETTASEDIYHFTVLAGGLRVVFDGSDLPCNGSGAAKLVNDATGINLGQVCGHYERDLTAGSYTIDVPSAGSWPSGTYTFNTFVKPAAQSFEYAVGQKVEDGKIGGVATAGAGNLETTASEDVYHFTVPAGGLRVVFDGSGLPCNGSGTAKLVKETTGESLGGVCGHYERDLAEGAYTIDVPSAGSWPSGTYWFSTFVKPVAQVFDYAVGQKVEDGKVGGVVTPGAGNLEATASEDIYHFTVPAGGLRVVFDGSGLPCNGSGAAKLVKDATGANLGQVCGHYERDLAEGAYTIDVPSAGSWPSGTYWFNTFVKPTPQSFDYAVGQKVEDGKIGGVATAGAGNLETTASEDIYHFTVPAGGLRVVFDGSGLPCNGSGAAKLVKDATGENLGGVCNHYERDLAAGAYTIDIPSAGSWPSGTYTFNTFGRPLPQVFDYAIGQKVENGKIGGVATPGAGNLETTASEDIYHFTVPAGGLRVVFDGSGLPCNGSGAAKLVRDTTGENLGGVCGHYERDLVEGSYTIDIPSAGSWPSGTYTFNTFVKPASQSFTFEIGDKVEDGKIGGVATPGAGNLETTASEDIYHFTVPAGGLRVVFDGSGLPCNGSGAAKLVNDATGENLGGVCGHYERDMAEGAYTIDIPSAGSWPSGTYTFNTFVKPAPQSFDYAIGLKVEDGKIGGVTIPGAGNLETTVSEDIYHFTVPAGGLRVVFDGSGLPCNGSGTAKLVNDATGANLGQVCGHYERDLVEGAYTIDIPSAGSWPSGTYTFNTFVKPAAQSFDYAIGQKVESGKIGDVVTSGAGNLETTASEDIYHFTVPAGGLRVVFAGDGLPCRGGTAKLVRDATGENLGGVCNLYERDLAAGAYTIDIPSSGSWPSGTYWFVTYTNTPTGTILAKWNTAGGVTGSLGVPTGAQACDGPVCWQSFQGGQIATVGNSAWITTEAIRQRWFATGGPTGALGLPTADRFAVPAKTGFGQHFTGGSVYEHTGDTSAHAVLKPIRNAWEAKNWEAGYLGYPTGEQQCDADTNVCWQNFQGGQIMSAGTGAWVTVDAIRQRWLDTGGATGSLGTPTGHSFTTTKDNGFGQHFQNGEIYGTTALGAHSVQAPVLAKWKNANYEAGTYGYPTAERTCTDTQCSQTFQGGTITAAK